MAALISPLVAMKNAAVMKHYNILHRPEHSLVEQQKDRLEYLNAESLT